MHERLNNNYEILAQELLKKHQENPFVSWIELDNMLGPNGQLEDLLVKISDSGYVFHGSQKLIKELEPRQAKDTGGIPGNEHYAIYATDMPSIALYMSLISNDKIQEQKKSVNYGAGVRKENDERTPYFSADQSLDEVMSNGYIYVLDKKEFSPISNDPLEEQFISTKVLHPRLIIETSQKDFRHTIDIIDKRAKPE